MVLNTGPLCEVREGLSTGVGGGADSDGEMWPSRRAETS